MSIYLPKTLPYGSRFYTSFASQELLMVMGVVFCHSFAGCDGILTHPVSKELAMDGIAQHYFLGQQLFGDVRLDRRLFNTFNAMALRPNETLPKKLPTHAELAGGYRFFNHDQVQPQRILEAHRQACLAQLTPADGVILLLHDTTVLDYSGLDVDELGQVGDGHGRGLYAHNTLAVRRSDRQVMGLMNQIHHQRADAPKGEKRAARQARKDRESRLWRDAAAAMRALPEGVLTIDISDRGSDISEYLDYEVNHGRKFIARSQHNRVLLPEESETTAKLHAHLRGLAPMFEHEIMVDESRKPRRMTLAWSKVTIVLPRQKRGEHGDEPLELVGLIVREKNPLDPKKPIEWILLTNLPVENAKDALQVVKDYACRWMIEEYHKAMKTGCGIEELQLTTGHGLKNAIALLSVLAVHILRLRCTARDEKLKDQPAVTIEDELKVRLAAKTVKEKEWRTMSVWSYHIAMAKLGGYVANPLKRPPGWLTLWRGNIRLNDMAEGARMLKKDV
jgi:hypothetical protein